MTEAENIESVFFKVLEDIKDYLEDLTLVGGWAPYVYARFLWENPAAKLITTSDVDFGIGKTKTKVYPRTIFQTLSPLDYLERHPRMDRLYPVVLYKKGRIPVEFIASPDIADDIIENLIGTQINVNKIDKFDFLLNHKIPIIIGKTKYAANYKIYCPDPAAFLYHKGITFTDRENEQKKSKDLYYIYFILRHAPDRGEIFKRINLYRKDIYFDVFIANLNKYFERPSSQGCMMVEKENGPDEFIDNVRQDAYKRFNDLQKLL